MEWLRQLHVLPQVGRYAVSCATERKSDEVRQCFEVTSVVSTLLAALPPGALTKKGSAVATNLRKLAQVQYELALVQRGRIRSRGIADDDGGGEIEAVASGSA
jgi:hypothetical protein